MSVKIPTLAQMKKDRVKTTYEYSVKSLLMNIHSAICSKAEYIDVPFNINNDEDRDLLERMITDFNKKGHCISKVAEVPEKRVNPQGQVFEYTAVRLRIHVEPLSFVKSKKKKIEKMVPQNRLDAVESDESETGVVKKKTVVKKTRKVGGKLMKMPAKKVRTKKDAKA